MRRTPGLGQPSCVPPATPHPAEIHSRAPHPGGRSLAWIAPLLIFSLLTVGGIHGSRESRREARVQEVSYVAELLARQVDEENLVADLPGVDLLGTSPPSGTNSAPAPGPSVRTLTADLTRHLREFESAFPVRTLTVSQDARRRWSRATLALAERRHRDVLGEWPPAHEAPGMSAAREDQTLDTASKLRTLQLQADAFYGLGQWSEALTRYLRIRELDPDRVPTALRVGLCQERMEQPGEALRSFEALARQVSRRGDRFLANQRPADAARAYRQAAGLFRFLVESRQATGLDAQRVRALLGQGTALLMADRASEAAASFHQAAGLGASAAGHPASDVQIAARALAQDGLGNALMEQGNAAEALRAYETARDLAHPLRTSGRALSEGTPSFDPATNLRHRADAHFDMRQPEAAVRLYEETISLLAERPPGMPSAEWARQLAGARNNRGAAFRMLGKIDSALADFDAAVALLEKLLADPGADQPAPKDLPYPRPTLDVALGISERGVDLVSRGRWIGSTTKSDLATSLAIAYRNRGHVRWATAEPRRAIEDFDRAVVLYERLVVHEGRAHLASQYVRALLPLAWIHGTHPEAGVRDAAKAGQSAWAACDMSRWKLPSAMEALAAARAEAAAFQEAVAWQEKAIALAPVNQHGPMTGRLALYRSEQPFRTTVPSSR